jgi:acyl carrier protein
MNVDYVESKTRHCIAEHLCVDLNKVTDDANLHDDLDADSLDAIELVMIFEEEFGLEIEDEEFEKCQTVGNVVKLLKSKIIL